MLISRPKKSRFYRVKNNSFRVAGVFSDTFSYRTRDHKVVIALLWAELQNRIRYCKFFEIKFLRRDPVFHIFYLRDHNDVGHVTRILGSDTPHDQGWVRWSPRTTIPQPQNEGNESKTGGPLKSCCQLPGKTSGFSESNSHFGNSFFSVFDDLFFISDLHLAIWPFHMFL